MLKCLVCLARTRVSTPPMAKIMHDEQSGSNLCRGTVHSKNLGAIRVQ